MVAALDGNRLFLGIVYQEAVEPGFNALPLVVWTVEKTEKGRDMAICLYTLPKPEPWGPNLESFN